MVSNQHPPYSLRRKNIHPDRQKRIAERALGTRYGKEHLEQTFLRKDPLAILYVRSHLRLVVNLQTNVKEMQTQFAQHRSDLRILNDQIRYIGQYYANKEVYSQFSNAKYRKEHEKEIQKYEEARDWLKSFYQDGKMTSLKTLTLQKEKLQQQIASEEEAISNLKEKLKDLDTADQNVDAMPRFPFPSEISQITPSHHNLLLSIVPDFISLSSS